MKRVDEREYELIKALQGAKGQTDASRLTGRSQPTVSSIWSTKTYDEYVNRFKKPTPVPAPVTVTVKTPQDEIHQLLLNIAATQNQMLNSQKAMAENVKFLAENMPIESRSRLHIFGK